MWPLYAERGSMPLWENAARNRGMKVVAMDMLPVELEFLRDGYLSALIGLCAKCGTTPTTRSRN
jgi:ribose transport system substrate-binding protein